MRPGSVAFGKRIGIDIKVCVGLDGILGEKGFD